MKDRNNNGQPEQGKHEHPLRQEIGINQKVQHRAAAREAEKDMDEDPEFTASSPNDDLDEGETARLGEDNSELI
jgi:hypothetical protein